MKRFCQTLQLRDDDTLIRQYVTEHQHVWPEIKQGIREVGILDMQIYLFGHTLFMICDTKDDFDWEKDNARLASLPRQAEWEAYMSRFQKAEKDATSTQKWQRMECIFKL